MVKKRFNSYVENNKRYFNKYNELETIKNIQPMKIKLRIGAYKVLKKYNWS